MPKTEHQPHTRESIFRDNCARFPHRPKILTEGDSWFDLPFPDRNIVDQLITHYSGEANWLRLEHIGDEATEMFFTQDRLDQVEGLGGHRSQRASLVEKLTHWRFQLMLISAGGNDLIGTDGRFFATLLKDGNGSDPANYLKLARLEAKIVEVLQALDELIRLRDFHQPGCPIVTHGYDYAIPQPKGAELFLFSLKGPWMWPQLQARGIVDRSLQRNITRLMIDRLNQRLQQFAAGRVNFQVIDARNSVDPQVGPLGWLDEIHPGARGFHAVAGRFVPFLREFCPGRFLRDWPLMRD